MNFQDLFKENGLSLDRLRTLIAVHDEGSIAAAAPDDTSQQTLYSRQITQLEKFFKTELKCKTGRTVQLNSAGRELAKLAREHLQALETFRRARVDQPVELTIGAGDSLLRWLVLPRIQAIREIFPSVVLELQDLQNLVICQNLQDSVIDFGLLRSDLVMTGSLNGKTLGKFGYSLFIPEHLCARDARNSTESLLQELPLAIQGGNTLFRRRLEEIATARNWKLNVRLRCQSFPQASQALESGQMAVILPDLARLAIPSESIWVRPVKELEDLRREVCLAWHPHRLETHPHLEKSITALIRTLKFSFCSGGGAVVGLGKSENEFPSPWAT